MRDRRTIRRPIAAANHGGTRRARFYAWRFI